MRKTWSMFLSKDKALLRNTESGTMFRVMKQNVRYYLTRLHVRSRKPLYVVVREG
jgi:hypothetical protein